MESRRNSILSNLDWVTIGIYMLLVVLGWFSIYGAVYNFEEASFFDFSYRYGKQLVWIACALVIAAVLLMLDSRIYTLLAYVIFPIMMLVLLAMVVFAALNLPFVPDIKGSHSWLVLGPVSIQPAEFAKTATSLMLAKLMSEYGFSLSRTKHLGMALAVIFLPVVLIVAQHETGSALVYFALTLVLYREGMSGIYLFLGFFAVVVFILSIRFGEVPIISMLPDESYGLFLVMGLTILVQMGFLKVFMQDGNSSLIVGGVSLALFLLGYAIYKLLDYPVHFTYIGMAALVFTLCYCIVMRVKARLWGYLLVGLFGFVSIGFSNVADKAFDHLMPHQQTRIKVTLGMENDPKKAGYNVNQSMIAIGSGGWAGKGFLNGTQTKLKYVPEQDTDFIFCTVGEEHGFIGSAVVLGLFAFLLLRLVYLAERQRSLFSRIYGYCVASIFFFHLFINIGMVTGLTPVIGIPLPFFSYGGSSLWSFTILLFIFLRLDASGTEYFGQ